MELGISSSDRNSSKEEILSRLGTSFSTFRNEHKGYRRIPDELRKRVIEALAEGIERSAIRASCKIKHSQISEWEEQFNSSPKSRLSPKAKGRCKVLEVIGSPKSQAVTKQPWFQLRIWSWELIIQKQ